MQASSEETDRSIDVALDAIRTLNAAMTAMVQSLEPQAAAQVARRMEQAIDRLAQEPNPPGIVAWQQIHAWRNQAGSLAAFPLRRPGS